jgi:hypothetical protein
MESSNRRNQMQKYVVRNGVQELEFTGEELSHASTERDDSVRWTEIKIYKTQGGNYVIQTLGVSVVYHEAGSKCTKKGQELLGSSLPEDAEPCFRCKFSGEDGVFNPSATYIMERNLSSAKVVEDPKRIQEAMTTYDNGRKVYDMSPVAKEALNHAAAKDPALLNQIITRVHVP